jgi:hypothetical protein
MDHHALELERRIVASGALRPHSLLCISVAFELGARAGAPQRIRFWLGAHTLSSGKPLARQARRLSYSGRINE